MKCYLIAFAGHGGFDPGKIGINGAKEKDINLAIALKLEVLLKAKGYEVVLTRSTDEGLYEEGSQNKKASDLKKRVALIEQINPVLTVSIHQNSFSQESSKGAQVFYYGTSEESKKLATVMQQTLKDYIADDNHRMEKSNESYYMLRKTSCPIIIVECGFLSNSTEAALLITDAYQDKMAEGICLGIENYLNSKIE